MRQSSESAMRWLAFAGAGLLVGVVAWRLSAGTYKGDIEKICHAERNSGAAADKEPSTVAQWTKAHLDTPQGSTFYSDLEKKEPSQRAKALDAERTRLGIGECPIVASLTSRQKTIDLRNDLRLICSMAAVPNIDKLAVDEQVSRLQAWAASSAAKSPQTQDLIANISRVAPEKRGAALRAAANGSEYYGCPLADILGRAPEPRSGDDSFLRLESAEINGDLTTVQVFDAIQADMSGFRDCYSKAASRGRAVKGPITIRFTVEPSGKVASSKGISGPDKESTDCLAAAVTRVAFPPPSARQASVILHAQFVPSVVADAGAAGLTDEGAPLIDKRAGDREPSPTPQP